MRGGGVRPRSTCGGPTSSTWASPATRGCPCWSSATSTAGASSPPSSARWRCSPGEDQELVAGSW
ncbi:hypothetical protein LT493_40270 [Streptomyces tricolor]|nr:hypothetical protein [Streptomyces tricolor]